MRMDTPVADGDPIVAGLLPEGVTLTHIIVLFQTAYPINGEQLLRARLGATHPTNLTPSELAEFIKWMLAALKSNGIPDPAAQLAAAAKLGSSAATTEDPFDGREHDGRVFRDGHDRRFFIGRLSRRQKEEWLRDHPDRWQTREEFLRDLQARAKTDVAAEPTRAALTPSAIEVPTGGQSNGPLPVSGEDKPQPHKPATNTAPPTINPEATISATAAADDEINIDGRRFVSEPRVAEMLGCSLRTLQRRRMEGKGPAFTKIGRKVFYELNDLQEWIDRGKIR